MDAAGNLFTDGRLQTTLAQVKGYAPEEVIRSVIDAVRQYCDNAAQSDDLTALAVRVGAAR